MVSEPKKILGPDRAKKKEPTMGLRGPYYMATPEEKEYLLGVLKNTTHPIGVQIREKIEHTNSELMVQARSIERDQ